MKSKTIIIVLIVFFVLIGLFVWGYERRGNTAANIQGVKPIEKSSLLSTEEILYDFGTISMKDGNVTKEFVFTNTSDKDMFVRRVETSCMCTAAYLVKPDGSVKGPFGMASMGANTVANETIKSGESRKLRVVYNPNAHGPAGVGSIDRFAIITDSSGGRIQFEIKALVKP